MVEFFRARLRRAFVLWCSFSGLGCAEPLFYRAVFLGSAAPSLCFIVQFFWARLRRAFVLSRSFSGLGCAEPLFYLAVFPGSAMPSF
jgi:hypothetical protein